MKKLYLVFGLVFCTAFANAQKVWDGGGANNLFSTAANWVGDAAPIPGEDVIFDGTNSKNCVINVLFAIGNFSMNSGYNGTISSSGSRIIGGNLFISSGTFSSTTGTLDVGGNFSLSGAGTFISNSGTVSFRVNSGTPIAVAGSPNFNTLQLADFGSGGAYNFDFGNSSAVNLIVDPGGGTGGAVWNFQGNITITGNLSLEALNVANPTANTGVFTFSGAGPITIDATASVTGANRLPNMVFNTTGAIDMLGDISVTGNWTHVDGDLTIGNGSTVHFYGSSSTIGTGASFENLTIESGASVTFPAGAEFFVGGDFTNNGTFNPPPTSVMSLNGGTNPQSISGSSFTMGSIRAMSGNRTITLSTPVTILDSLKLEDNVTFASGGNLTLNADASLKARLARLGTNAQVTGNVNVETYVPGPNTGWAQWGVNGVTGQIIDNWDGQIPMTCEGCDYGVTGIGSYFESIQGWNESTNNYDTTLNNLSPLTPGKGFWVYVGSSLGSTTDFTLTNTGPLVQGNSVSIPVSSGLGNGFNLVSNPYPCPIRWSEVYALNENFGELNDAYHVFSADRAGNGYADFSGGVSTPLNALTDIIPAGQGFFIENLILSSLDFTEDVKIIGANGNTASLQKTNNTIGTVIRLHLNGGAPAYSDETAFRIHPDASLNYDKKLDARKMFVTPGYPGFPGEYNLYTTISSRLNGVDYSINSLPVSNGTLGVEVLVKVISSGVYTISLSEDQPYNSCAVLHDKLNNSYHNLKLSPYTCYISDTTSSPRFELLLCEFGNPAPTFLKELNASNTIFIVQDGNTALVNTRFETETEAEISVYNLLGQKLMNDIQVQGTETSTRLPLDITNQVIFVKVSTNTEVVTKKLLLGR